MCERERERVCVCVCSFVLPCSKHVSPEQSLVIQGSSTPGSALGETSLCCHSETQIHSSFLPSPSPCPSPHLPSLPLPSPWSGRAYLPLDLSPVKQACVVTAKDSSFLPSPSLPVPSVPSRSPVSSPDARL